MLEISNVSVAYNEKQVLSDLSLTLQKGKLVGLVGCNGSGKSTLLKTIVNIIKPKTGSVVIDGASIAGMNQLEIAKRVAYLPQGRATPDMTAAEMVLLGRFAHLRYPRRYTAEDHRLARQVMDGLGIGELRDASLRELSGGMRQTVYIAMAMAQGSEYILLDEPTTYLDISHQIDLMRQLRAIAAEGKGVFAVMHDLALAFSFCDEIHVLHDGKILLSGAPRDLFCSPVIRKIFGVELCEDPETRRYFCRY